jgi:hypothetical protein
MPRQIPHNSRIFAFWIFGLATATAVAAEPSVQSTIQSVSMFKNGLALVEREAKIAGPGDYQIVDIPRPVHGTLWFIGAPGVSARVVMRDIEREAFDGEIDIRKDLVGRQVTVTLRDSDDVLTGTIRRLAEKPSETGLISDNRPYRYTYSSFGETHAAQQTPQGIVVLETRFGEVFINQADILLV